MTRQRKQPLIRRVRDEDGKLVTYLPSSEVCDVVGVCATTISRWVRCGAVRYTDRLNGSRNVAVVDVVRMRMTPSKETLALGIKRIPENDRAAMDAFFDREQAKTRQTATSHREEWDSYDEGYLIAAYGGDVPVETMALHLGRTYASVSKRLDVLKSEGDLPRKPRPVDDWADAAMAMLTPDERLSLLTPDEQEAPLAA